MKNAAIIALLTILLFSCGGSEGEGSATETLKKDPTVNLATTSWEKACFPDYDLSSDEPRIAWYLSVKLTIDSSLTATYKTAFFRPTDTECHSMMFDALDISTFEITGKIISEESIVAYGLNETFIYNSDNSKRPPNYSLIYIDSEKLYFGQNSGENLGETPQTRHSSISLDDYFSQVIK